MEHGNYIPVTMATHGHLWVVYKQLSTQGTITSCSLNKLDTTNQQVLDV